MSEGNWHPEAERLEEYVEQSLSGGDRAALESHLLECRRCQAEVGELRTLFAALEELPRLAPAGGFADRVMAGVSVRRRTAWARLAERLRALVPRGRAGWALAAAALAAPVVTTATGLAWILSRPAVTPQALWLYGSERLWSLILDGIEWGGRLLIETRVGAAMAGLFEILTAVEPGQLGLAAVAFAALTTLSAWILYSNLIRPSRQERGYVSYSF